MKKYLYVLKVRNQAFVIFENDKVKYFKDEAETCLENLQKYLKDKVYFKYLKVEREKIVQYNGESYFVKRISLEGFEGIIDDKCIKVINNIERENLDYKDIKLLDSFYVYGFSLSKIKKCVISDAEKSIAKKNFYIAILLAVLTSIFCMTGNEFNYIGISYPIVILLLAAGGIYSIGKTKKINYIGLYFTILAVVLSMTYGIFSNIFLRVTNFFIIPFVLGTGLYLLSYSEESFDYINFKNNILPNITVSIFNNKPFGILKRVLFNPSIKKTTNTKTKGIEKGIIISIPLLIVLISLLSSSDPLFGEIFKSIRIDIASIIRRITISAALLQGFIGACVFCVGYCFLSRLKFKEIKRSRKIKRYFNIDTVNTVLIMVNILYAFFTFIQINSLFIRYSGILSAAKYSEYARKGFFELVLVVVINIFIILISQSRVKPNNLTKILNTIMTIISMGMTISSMYRMNLYITQYGLTRLRFITSIFMMFILVSLIFISVSLCKRVNLFKYIILVGSVFYVLMNFANMDKLIANYNLNKVQGEIDIKYLTSLSKDSSEVMNKAYYYGKIDAKTYKKYIENNRRYKESKWFEYNYYNSKLS